jgi:hypothetical protein
VQHEVEQLVPEVSVTRADLETEAGRSALLARLLAACTSAGQASRAGRLAQGWQLPGHMATLASRLLQLGADGQQAALELLEGAEALDREEAEGLVEGAGEDGLLGAQLVLLLGLQDRYEGAVQVLLTVPLPVPCTAGGVRDHRVPAPAGPSPRPP